MAALQMFFSITMRLKPAEEAIGSVDKVSSAERKASEEEKRKAREEEISGRPARRDAEG